MKCVEIRFQFLKSRFHKNLKKKKKMETKDRIY
jgi:hypothetical protein